MKLSIVLAIALLSGSFPLVAQQSNVSGGQSSLGLLTTTGPNKSTLQVYQLPATTPNCPAMFTARHLSDGSMVRTGGTHPKGPGQSLHVTLNVSQGAIATLAVRGFSNKGRMTETSLGSAPDAVRTVTTYLAATPNGQAGGNVWAPDLTAVASIDLVSLKYDDGTSWSAPSGKTCHVTPDPMMLITAR
jgi:hypothetical protein